MIPLLILWNDLGRVFREKQALFWIFLAPLVFTTFFGLVFREQPARPLTVAILNRDRTDELSRMLRTALEQDKVVVTATRQLRRGQLTIEIPAGAAAAWTEGKALELTLHAGEDETSAERNLRFKVQKALIAAYFTGGDDAGAREAGGEASASISASGPLAVTPLDLGVKRREVTAGFQRSVPAYLVMFVFMNLMVSGAGIAEDRASGRLRRLWTAPVSRQQIVVGKLLGRFAIGWIQIGYMLLVGVLVFRIRWAEHIWVFFGFLTIFALASAAAGVFFGTLFKDPDKCATLAVWIVIVLSPLGGLWWPLEVVGPTMRRVAYVVPTGWAMEGVNAMLAFGAGARDVAPFGLAFAVMFATFTFLAARRLQP